MDKARHAWNRGMILRCLSADFDREMTGVAVLQRTLDTLGVSLSEEDLAFHLAYLGDQGYVRIWRVREVTGFRRDRVSGEKPDAIRFVKLLPRGLQLLDGHLAEDPMVAF